MIAYISDPGLREGLPANSDKAPFSLFDNVCIASHGNIEEQLTEYIKFKWGFFIVCFF